MSRNWWPILILAIATAILAVAIYSAAVAAPSLEQVRRAANLYPGRSVDINVDGQIVHITFVSIQQIKNGRYAIIVNAR